MDDNIFIKSATATVKIVAEANVINEIINSISYIAMGMYLAYIYAKENNIYINIGVHSLNNILSMIVLLLFV